MKIKKYNDLFEFKNYLDEQELMEMANIDYKKSGIDNIIIWLGPNPKSHGLRIKVSNIPNKFDGSDCFTITIPDFKIIGDVNKSLVNNDNLNKIFKFVEKNKVVIEKYSNYEISTNELIDGLKKWDD